MQRIESYLLGEWRAGSERVVTLENPATLEPLAECATGRFDAGAVLAHARRAGRRLAAMTFPERGQLLSALSKALHEEREALIEVSIANAGATRSDAKFDVDGATGTLAYYGHLAKSLPERPYLVDGEVEPLGRTARFSGVHLCVPREGVGVHVNAFNFPAWGQMEKLACAILAGVPVIEKAGTPTALVAWRVARRVVESGVLPEGAYQFIAGGVGDLLEHLGPQDALAFTGSSRTAAQLRGLSSLLERAVRVNVEADSLNAAVLAPDVDESSESYGLFLSNVVLDMTQKAGQKCTAVRRVLVPKGRIDAVREELTAALARVVAGDPSERETRLGPLASAAQREDVVAGIERLAACCEVALGGTEPPCRPGHFVAPTLLVARDPDTPEIHDREVFGPVATLLAYDGTPEGAVDLVRRGAGGLVCSAYSNDADWSERFVLGAAPWHGRVWLAGDRSAEQAAPPGTVLPQSVHGGPGRAGGGEELGGRRGLELYLQRTAVQGFGGWLEKRLARS